MKITDNVKHPSVSAMRPGDFGRVISIKDAGHLIFCTHNYHIVDLTSSRVWGHEKAYYTETDVYIYKPGDIIHLSI